MTDPAIPLEYFIHSGRIVLGAVFVQSLRGASFVLRLGANLIRETGKLLIAAYDIVIFVPLAIERWVKRARSQEPEEGSTVRAVPSLENQYMGR